MNLICKLFENISFRKKMFFWRHNVFCYFQSNFRFVRNITADQISVQILSGKGELKNIELNEIVLSEVSFSLLDSRICLTYSL